ncbi:glycosyl transferase [Bremerella sp. P1]|uniref:glycosyl transferase n=1 Tax=Bremerella sp. P1 TaxID=3026424 RepID=UPI002368D47A|nr:glycosyl transferase [Bremerella sp. P1]WDI45152.1 glycosyl transferase [Bremerella sp. P1]
MSDFIQQGPISTLHDFGTLGSEQLERTLEDATTEYPMGLILPVTASDMRAPAFSAIMDELEGTKFLKTVVVVLNRAPDVEDYRECRALTSKLGNMCRVLWNDGPRGQAAFQQLTDAGFNVSVPGKGRAVWTAFGYLLADPDIKAMALHDCDIVNYHRDMLMRLCLPMAHPGFDFDFCKAYYARVTDRMHGRVVRLLVTPLLRSLIRVLGNDDFLVFLNSFRYPLSGEFAVTSTLVRANRIPSDWGLEVGTLAEVFRNTAPKRICQIDLGHPYEHKHQPISLEDANRGLMKMTADILHSIYRTLSSRGIVFSMGMFNTLESAYLRDAQDAIRQYHADAVINGLNFDRHTEEHSVEGFARMITQCGQEFFENPVMAHEMPTWTRVRSAIPDFPHTLRRSVEADSAEYT